MEIGASEFKGGKIKSIDTCWLRQHYVVFQEQQSHSISFHNSSVIIIGAGKQPYKGTDFSGIQE